jgi:hypothetical protein
MAYSPTTPLLGIQPIAVTSTTQNHPLGYQVDGYDPTFGSGSFVYLEGVGSTVVGSVVSYNQLAGTTTLAAEAAHITDPIAVAMSANIASQFGWYQVRGAAVVTRVTGIKTSPGVDLYVSATAGSLTSAVVTGKQVLNLISINAATVASATTTITAQIAYPTSQGEII